MNPLDKLLEQGYTECKCKECTHLNAYIIDNVRYCKAPTQEQIDDILLNEELSLESDGYLAFCKAKLIEAMLDEYAQSKVRARTVDPITEIAKFYLGSKNEKTDEESKNLTNEEDLRKLKYEEMTKEQQKVILLTAWDRYKADNPAPIKGMIQWHEDVLAGLDKAYKLENVSLILPYI